MDQEKNLHMAVKETSEHMLGGAALSVGQQGGWVAWKPRARPPGGRDRRC